MRQVHQAILGSDHGLSSVRHHAITVKPVCKDHLYNKIYYL